MRRGRTGLGIGGFCLLTLALALSPSASAGEFVVGPPRVVASAWEFPLRTELGPNQRSVEIVIAGGYCVGEPAPVFDHVKVVERPNSERPPRRSAVITAYIRYPAPREYRGPVEAGEMVICSDLGSSVTTRIRLKRPVSRLALFDGEDSPPRRVRLRR
jgi:hypothetical protein